MSRLDIYRNLPRPETAGSWSAEAANGTAWRVARSYDDHPAILIAFEGPPSSASMSRRLANISYVPPAPVDIVAANGEVHSGRMAVLECRSDDVLLADHFFRIAGALLFDQTIAPTERSLEQSIDAIVTLFRAIQRPGERSIQGLWGELAIIAWAPDPEKALSAWHSSPRALHDFSAGNERLEVKSTTRDLREHSFRLEQLSRHGGAHTIIASLVLTPCDDGVSVNDLVQQIAKRVGGESERRLVTLVAQSLGAEWREADNLRFDPTAARDGLRLYLAEQVPSVASPVPAEVKDVRFTVDLSSVPEVQRNTVLQSGALFASLLG